MSSIKKIPDRVMFFITNLTNNRPLCFLSAVGGARDVLIGLGFLFGLEEIRQTRLYQNYEDLVPGYSGVAVGLLLLLIGSIVAATSLSDRVKWTRMGLNVQAFAWLFSMIMYAMHGNFVLAAVFGLFFSVPAGYLAYYYKNTPLWAERRKRFRDQWIIEHEETK